MAQSLKPETKLIDLAIRDSFTARAVPKEYRDRLQRARKFVLDFQMSAHLADLTCAPFVGQDPLFIHQVADGARRLARLPYEVTWIEYDCRARKLRTEAEYNGQVLRTSSGYGAPAEDVIPRVGWLLEQHPKIPTAYRMTEFAEVDNDCVAMPMSYTWVSDDETVLPWKNLPFDTSDGARHPSEIATGVMQFISDRVGVTAARNGEYAGFDATREMMLETMGELRAVWTLLATLNDLPVVFDAVRPSKGHMVKGSGYRRFVDHSTIRLMVPGHRSLRTLAQRALIGIHRRAHEVRGHWRNDWRHPRTPGCEHVWGNLNDHVLKCQHCDGRRVWISTHTRGNDRKGFMLHDYSVERKEPA